MGLLIARTNSKTRIATRRRRGAKARGFKALCEALEERQLMSLTIEVRDAGGGTSVTVSSVGQVVSLKVLAVITDPTNNPSLDGVQDVSGDFLSTAQYGHAVAGNLVATNLAPFKASGAAAGTLQDLNGDGNIDVGINFTTTTSTAGLFFARSSPVQTGGSGTGTISGNSLIFQIGTLNYTVTNLNEGGQTSINFSPYVPGAGKPDAAGWVENGMERDNTNGVFQAGTPYIVSDPPLVVAPVAKPFSATVTKNTPTIINELSVDDVVVPLNDASVTITSAVAHGTTALQSNGSILYTPNTGYLGADSFTYTVADTGGLVSNQTTVSITVVPAPPPVAVADTATTIRDQPVTINVLANDTVSSPATIVPSSVAILTGASHGTAVAQSGGTVLYTPVSGFTGTDTFTYTETDTNAETSAAGTVTVTIAAPVPPTVPINTPEDTTEGAPLSIDLPAIVTAGTSPVSLTSVVIVTAATNGTAAPQTDGTILYSPTPGFTGNDSFTYTVADTLGNVSNVGTISLTISHGVPPTATNITAPVLAGQGNPINVLAGSNSGAPLVPGSVKVATQPTNGQATVDTTTGLITYTPVAGFIGTDSFTYTVGNTNLDVSAPATVSVDVGTLISNAKGSAHSLSFVDAANGLEIISLNKGTAEIFFSGTGSVSTIGTKATVTGQSLSIEQITLTGTTKASTLSVKGSVKTPATVGAIIDASPLGSINAPSLGVVEQNVGGVVSNGQSINLSGGVGSIILGSISGSAITIGAGAAKVSLTAGAVSNTTLTSAVPITTLKVASWTTDGSDSITAPAIGNLIATGAFQPNLALSAPGKLPAISNAKITGALGGTWNVSGAVNSATLGSVTSGWTGNLAGASVKSFTVKSGGLASNLSAGAIGSLTIIGDLTGSISGSSAKLIKVTGAVTGSSIGINGALGQVIIGGAMTNSSIIAAQNITAISAGSITGSSIAAGSSVIESSPVVINFAQITAANVGTGKIGNIKTGAFASSTVEASKINSASIGTVNTANNSTAFGIATDSLGTFAGVFGDTAIHASHSVLTNEEVLQADLQTLGAQLGDFTIALLS